MKDWTATESALVFGSHLLFVLRRIALFKFAEMRISLCACAYACAFLCACAICVCVCVCVPNTSFMLASAAHQCTHYWHQSVN